MVETTNLNILLIAKTFVNNSIDSVHLEITGYMFHRYDRDLGSGKRGGRG